MPLIDITRHNYQGNENHPLVTGATIRPRDPREDPYRAALHPQLADWRSVDLSKYVSLVPDNGPEPRTPVTWQGGKGSCAAETLKEISEGSARLLGKQPVALSAADLYERDRKKENGANWQQDSGSTLADNCDFAISGLYAAADAPEGDDLTRDYDAQTAGKQTYTYVSAHHAAYPGEDADPDYLIKVAVAALMAGYFVDFGSYWPQVWFNPDANGMLPMQGASIYSGIGAHSYAGYGWLPILGGCFLCPNHWNPPGGNPWNPQVARMGFHARPGDFLLPAAALRGPQPLVFELRVVSYAAPDPAPQPQPNPQPQPGPSGTAHDQAMKIAGPLRDKAQKDLEADYYNAPKLYFFEGLNVLTQALDTGLKGT